MRSHASVRGFTLLELSVVLTIIAVVIGGGLMIMTSWLQASQYNATVATMDAIERALLDFATVNTRIPCPSDLTIAQGAANYGAEAGSSVANTTGTCHGGTPAATHYSASGTEEGGVPTRALKLPDSYMYDGWGHRIRYAVDPTYTASGALPVPVGGPCGTSASAITVSDATSTARTSAGIYALISHGANGHGAYTGNGVTFSAGSTNTDELRNCNCTSAGVYSGTYTPTYVQKTPTLDSATATDNFDDIVAFKEAWQMQRQNFALTTPGCSYIYVLDAGNNRVQKFTSGGTFVLAWGTGYNGAGGTIGGTGSGNGQFNFSAGTGIYPQIYIDSSHNVWVADAGNSRVQEFDSNGNYKNQFGGAGTLTGTFYEPSGITVDSNKNIWGTDYNYRYRIEEWNSSLVSLGQSPAYPATAGTCTGKFTYPAGIAIDPSGNLWVTEDTANCVSKWNSSGVYQSNISTGGNRTYGIFFDSSGNMWVTDPSLMRVYTFDSTGSARNVFSGHNYFGTSGSSNGQFSYPTGIYVDSSGYIWVADAYNYRVQKLNSSGTFQLGIGAGYNGVSGSIGSSGTGNGQFNLPTGIYLDTQ